jgi:hypothetical protein
MAGNSHSGKRDLSSSRFSFSRERMTREAQDRKTREAIERARNPINIKENILMTDSDEDGLKQSLIKTENDYDICSGG